VLKAKKVCIPVIYSKYEVDKENKAKIRSRQALFQLKTIVLPKLNKKSSLIQKTRVDPISKKNNFETFCLPLKLIKSLLIIF